VTKKIDRCSSAVTRDTSSKSQRLAPSRTTKAAANNVIKTAPVFFACTSQTVLSASWSSANIPDAPNKRTMILISSDNPVSVGWHFQSPFQWLLAPSLPTKPWICPPIFPLPLLRQIPTRDRNHNNQQRQRENCVICQSTNCDVLSLSFWNCLLSRSKIVFIFTDESLNAGFTLIDLGLKHQMVLQYIHEKKKFKFSSV